MTVEFRAKFNRETANGKYYGIFVGNTLVHKMQGTSRQQSTIGIETICTWTSLCRIEPMSLNGCKNSKFLKKIKLQKKITTRHSIYLRKKNAFAKEFSNKIN
jgi:hypothetical protein